MRVWRLARRSARDRYGHRVDHNDTARVEGLTSFGQRPDRSQPPRRLWCSGLLANIRRTRTVTLTVVAGVLCLYLLLGLFFAVGVRLDRPSNGQCVLCRGTSGEPVERRLLQLHHHDNRRHTATSLRARTSAHAVRIEALIGQMLLVTVVGAIVAGSFRCGRRMSDEVHRGRRARVGGPSRSGRQGGEGTARVKRAGLIAMGIAITVIGATGGAAVGWYGTFLVRGHSTGDRVSPGGRRRLPAVCSSVGLRWLWLRLGAATRPARPAPRSQARELSSVRPVGCPPAPGAGRRQPGHAAASAARASKTRATSVLVDGEGGIRTLAGGLPPDPLSRRAPSATRPPLHAHSPRRGAGALVSTIPRHVASRARAVARQPRRHRWAGRVPDQPARVASGAGFVAAPAVGGSDRLDSAYYIRIAHLDTRPPDGRLLPLYRC